MENGENEENNEVQMEVASADENSPLKDVTSPVKKRRKMWVMKFCFEKT